MLIIPAIDIKDNKCVRLYQGDIKKIKFYDNNPLEVAKIFKDEGAEFLHIIDIDATQTSKLTNFNIIEEIIKKVKIKIQVGGGIRSIRRINQYLNIGVTRVIVSTLVYNKFDDTTFIKNLFKKYGDKLVVAIDSKDGFVSIYGWQKNTKRNIFQFAKTIVELGCKRIIITDITRDGTLTSPNFGLIEKLTQAVNIPIIASGGISSLAHIKKLKKFNLEGVIIGKALYENKIKLKEAIRISRNLS